MKILVTGVGGFIGGSVCRKFRLENFEFYSIGRAPFPFNENNHFIIDDYALLPDFSQALIGIDCIIHCAGLAHSHIDSSEETLDLYRSINVEPTIRLAKEAVKHGVSRFIYLSSIKVNGESTGINNKFKSSDFPNPQDAYGISKFEAELALQEISATSGLQVVIIRPTLVYGPCVKGNFARLLKLINLGIPLPFGSLINSRAMVSIDNLIDLIVVCIEHPRAPGKVFLASDGADLSICDLTKFLSRNLHSSCLIFPLPLKVISFIDLITFRFFKLSKLSTSLCVDTEDAYDFLAWTPRFNVYDELTKVTSHYLNHENKKFYIRTKRIFDFLLASFSLVLLSPIFMLVALIIKITSEGSILYWSARFGVFNDIFMMPKFRTMQTGTPVLPTHLLSNCNQYLTSIGSFLRKYSLDELPQLWSILIGDMSFVGPRPALFNQNDLIALRAKYGIDRLKPGLTGWAQINGRDELSIPIKVGYELQYLNKQSFGFDMKIMCLTFLKVLRGNGVCH